VSFFVAELVEFASRLGVAEDVLGLLEIIIAELVR
jgi:hypothetical protein